MRHRALDPSQKTTELRPAEDNEGGIDEPLFPSRSDGSARDPDTPPTMLAGTAVVDDCAEFELSDYLAELERYEIEGEISRGGMGLVLKARDRQLHRDVAIKILGRKLRHSEVHRERFIAEAQTTGQLQHPGVVPIYDIGFCRDDRPYFTMKLVEGETFSKMIVHAPRNNLARYRCLKVFEKVCDAIAYAHSQGVLHLDIKPANVMVGQFGEVHVMDWGLSCMWEDQRVTHLDQPSEVAQLRESEIVPLAGGTINGTPSYMSPEQARDNLVDPRSDVFGLGGLLCEILTGKPPFQGQTLQQVCARAAWGRHDEAISALNHCNADAELIELAKDCLAIDPDDRPDHAGQVAYEITSHLELATEYAHSDLERFFDLSMDLFCIAGVEGYFHRVNSNFSRVLGFEQREILSRPIVSFVHPDDREKTEQALEVLRAGKPVVQFHNRYRDRDGKYHTFEWTAKTVPGDNTIFAVARDVTGTDRDVT